MKSELPFYREYLRSEFIRRTRLNSQYSMRSFARALGLEAGSLSQILSGKRSISKRVADRVLSRLELSDEIRRRFLESILSEKESLGITKIPRALRGVASAQKDGSQNRAEAEVLESARFAVISDWFHYAILEMTQKPNFKLQSAWIAERLAISPAEANVAIERLLSLNLIEKSNGRWKKTRLIVDTLDKSKTTLFHRKRVRQVLEKSVRSLENDPIEIRNHVGTTVCVDPSRIPEAKARVQKFIWELTEFLGGDRPEQVYEIAIQFFPLEKTLEKSPEENAAKTA